VLDNGHSLVATVARDPEAIAVVDGAKRISYAELFQSALRIANALDRLGLNKGDHLVTLLQNNWQSVVLHWACQFSGVIITPVNWRANADEVKFFVHDATARAVVYQDVSQEAVKKADLGKPVTISIGIEGEQDNNAIDFDELLMSEPMSGDPRVSASDTSVMLYTSGTTGTGKGVPRSHQAERASSIAHVAQNQYGYGERTLGVMPLYHTMGVRALLAMAVVSGCFICQPRFNAAQALKLIESERITSLYLVPTLFHDLINAKEFETTDISSVSKLGFAGAAMTDGLLTKLDRLFKPRLFVNHYGSSEVYTFTVCDNAVVKPGSAGKAGINEYIRVVELDGTSAETNVPVCVEGQIITSLNSIEAFQGYWNRPDADKNSIRDGWYFTGDIGFLDKDGDLFVTGRVDDMIITGGENVMPAEIESLLSTHPDVSEVAVVGLPHERWGQQVTAFIKSAAPIDAVALDDFCKDSNLANFKRPRSYLFVNEIPKSPVGKILRRSLRDTYTTKFSNSPVQEKSS